MAVPEKPPVAQIREMMKKEGRGKTIGPGHAWFHDARARFQEVELQHSYTSTPSQLDPKLVEQLNRYREKLFVKKQLKLHELDELHKLLRKAEGRVD